MEVDGGKAPPSQIDNVSDPWKLFKKTLASEDIKFDTERLGNARSALAELFAPRPQLVVWRPSCPR